MTEPVPTLPPRQPPPVPPTLPDPPPDPGRIPEQPVLPDPPPDPGETVSDRRLDHLTVMGVDLAVGADTSHVEHFDRYDRRDLPR